MTFKRVIVFVVLAKVWVFFLLYLLFLRTPCSDIDTFFFFRDSKRSESRDDKIRSVNESFWERLAPYDGQWYLDIASNGYRQLSKEERLQESLPSANYAFFPLLPWVIRGIKLVTGSYLPLAVLLLLASSSLGLVASWKLAKNLGTPPELTILLLFTFPTAAFQYALYTEGVFLLLSVATILLARKNRVLLCAITAALAGLCRPQGILLSLPLFFDLVYPVLRGRSNPRKLVGSALVTLAPFSGFIALSIVSLVSTGDLFSFLTIQSSWGRSYSLLSVLKALFSAFTYNGPPADLLGLLFGVVLLPVLWRKLPTSLAAYGTGMVLLPLMTGSLLSLGRFMSVSIPHFLCLAILLRGRPYLTAAAGLLFLVGQVLLAKGLIGWHFVG